MISAKREVETVKIGPEMVKAWAVEIQVAWAGTRVRRVEGADLWAGIRLYPKGWLIFSWFPETCGCGIIAREVLDGLLKLGKRQPPIVLALKSQIMGARLTGAEQLNADRVLLLHFSRPVGLGISQPRTLILEASPRFSNLILADGNLQVLETGCHGRPGDGGPGRTRPGFSYQPPPVVQGVPPSKWPPVVTTEVFKGLRGIGKGLSEALRGCWDDLQNPREALFGLYNPKDSAPLDSFLPQRVGDSLSVFPFILPTAKPIPGSPLEATGAELAEGLLARASLTVGKKPGSGLARESRRLRNRLDGLRRQLAECEQAELWKKYGEALLSSMVEIPEKALEIEIPCWGASGPEMLRVPVDPGLTRVQNAQACFKRYRKGNSIKEQVGAELRKLEMEIASLEQDEILAEALALCAGGIQQGVGKAPGRKKGGKDSGVHRFEIGDFPVLVGTSAFGNRQVTFRLSSPEDLWLHVKDLPGAHVIVKTGKRPVPQAVIEQAAGIAAFFSKARMSPFAVVEMTERRHVRSRQGQNPGSVFYTQSTAITVRPGLPGAGS
jgi:predicted ribosome quality control (RQC) complex YloA/Tae2 family protein